MNPVEDTGPRRKWVAAECYRFMVLAALAHRSQGAATKGDLAWETRGNHYVVTRTLNDLASQSRIRVARVEPTGYRIEITDSGREFLLRNRRYVREEFGPALEQQYRYGRRPAWLDGLLRADPA